MRDSEPPLPPPSPRPASRLRRTLHSLRSPFRAASPFHLGSLARSPSAASSASDGDLARDERTMRKRNKKTRDLPASDASRSTDSSPSVDKKKEGFIRRMGSIGKKRGEGASSTPPSQHDTKESTIESPTPPPGSLESVSTTPETASPKPPTPELPTPEPPTPEPPTPEPSTSEPENAPPPAAEPSASDLPSPVQRSEQIVPEPVSPIAVERVVATRLFSKSAWKKHSEHSMDRPVEDPSPESALRRRIAFVAQASACLSEDHEEEGGAGREVGSLEEAVALARVRLAPAQAAAPHERGNDTEEEGYADAMPAYGDLIEPVKPGNEPVSADCRGMRGARSHGLTSANAVSGGRHSGRCARAMSVTFEETGDDSYLTVCDCCGFSAETTLVSPVRYFTA